ncbi:MAG TPA: ABC transporter substrate-binding protein [Lacisediminihabitans sp.]|uniref:sugar ABC transporter substrate-binding protein n=1 Tax=Lacisediminihabitans sp. TaxID=2787631 RepID=UPI002ED85CFC
MKRKIPLVVGTVGVMLALAACSGTSASSPSGGKVTLTMWTGFTGGDRPGYAQIVKDYNASQDKVKVVMDVEPWDTIQQKLPSAWLTGQGPDLAAPSSDPNVIAQYVKTGSVLPITETGSGSGKVNVGDIAPALIKEFTYNKKLYAVPANYATLSLYYNKTEFAAAGISSPPTTLAEFKADAQKLTIDGGTKQYGLALADNNTIQMWPILQWLEGGDIVNAKGCSVLQTSAGQSSLKAWSDLVVDDKVAPVGLTGAEADSLFSAGKAAMEMNGPWAASGFKSAGIDLGIAKIPVGVDGAVTLGSTAPLAISAKTKHAQQAQEFLAYYTSKAVQKKFSLTTGFPPVRTDLADDAQLKADPVISIFAAQVSDARLYLPHVTNATQVDANGYIPLIGQITRGQSVATQTAAAAKTINALTGCSS